MNIDDAVAGLIVDERRHLSQLSDRRRREIENWNVAIDEMAEWFRLGEFRGQIEHRGYTEARGCGCFAPVECPANPDLWSNLVPWPALTPIVKQRELLA